MDSSRVGRGRRPPTGGKPSPGDGQCARPPAGRPIDQVCAERPPASVRRSPRRVNDRRARSTPTVATGPASVVKIIARPGETSFLGARRPVRPVVKVARRAAAVDGAHHHRADGLVPPIMRANVWPLVCCQSINCSHLYAGRELAAGVRQSRAARAPTSCSLQPPRPSAATGAGHLLLGATLASGRPAPAELLNGGN
jgi:hypothetical protein